MLLMQNKDVVQLQIGYHILEGKRLPLKKPMAILESHRPQQPTSSSSQPARSHSQPGTSNSSGGDGGGEGAADDAGTSAGQPELVCRVSCLLGLILGVAGEAAVDSFASDNP